MIYMIYMIISHPASPSRIIVLFKTLQHIIENLKKKVKERNAALEKTERKEPFFDQIMQKTFQCVATLRSKLNELN